MDFQSAMETFAEAWVAANAGQQVSSPTDIQNQVCEKYMSMGLLRFAAGNSHLLLRYICIWEYKKPSIFRIQNESVEGKQSRHMAKRWW